MRFVAIALPFLRVELVRETANEHEDPLAVVIARPGGAVKDETSLLGNTRLDVVSPEARAFGIRAGQTIASARARASELRVRVVKEDAVRGALAAVAEACLAFGPTVAFDQETDVVFVDVTGCAHLHRTPEDTDGEPTLAKRIEALVASMGHVSRIAVADGPRVASACARFASGKESVILVPPGQNREAMRVLPLAALPLGAEHVAWLEKVGLRRVGDLQSVPARSLGTRLGARAGEVLSLVRGEDSSPLTPYVPPRVLEERIELDEGTSSTEALLFVAKTLCRRTSARLAGQWIAASRLELELSLDRALLPEGEARTSPARVASERARPGDPARALLSMKLPVPLASEEEIFAVLRARIEPLELAAPAIAITLRVPERAPRPGTPLSLLTPESKATFALPRLVAELSAEIGIERVGTLAIGDSWLAEDRSRLVPYGTKATTIERGEHATEPLRLLPQPIHLERGRMLRHLLRIEGAEWWRRPATRSDFVACFADGGIGWVEVESDGPGSTNKRAWLRGWLV
jgi:protein ImuB